VEISGTGKEKELIASAIRAVKRYRAGQALYFAWNCSAMQEFADRIGTVRLRRKGLFKGGGLRPTQGAGAGLSLRINPQETLFLRRRITTAESGATRAKLLRVLQGRDGSQRVGGRARRRLFRLICAHQ